MDNRQLAEGSLMRTVSNMGEISAEIEAILSSPATSGWLRDNLSKALERDCVDAANDAELLSNLLSRRCAALLEQSAL